MNKKEIPNGLVYDPKILAERVTDLRKEKGYTLSELSKKINEKTKVTISAAQLGKYENTDMEDKKAVKMSMNTLQAIADLYEVSVDYLVGRSNIKSIDLTDKEIEKKLGLSGDAIKMLYQIKGGNYTFPEGVFAKKIINFMLEDSNFLAQLTLLMKEYCEAQEGENTNGKNKNPSKINNLDVTRYSIIKIFEKFIDSFKKDTNSQTSLKSTPLFDLSNRKTVKKKKNAKGNS